MAELEGLLAFFAEHPDVRAEDRRLAEPIRSHLRAVEEAQNSPERRRMSDWISEWRGAALEHATSNLDAAEGLLLRMAPSGFVIGELPALLAFARSHLRPTDERLLQLQGLRDLYASLPPPLPPPGRSRRLRAFAGLASVIAPSPSERCDGKLCDSDRETIAAAHDAAAREARREVARVGSFCSVLRMATTVLFVGAALLVIITFARPSVLPLCFMPVHTAVCPTSTGPDGGAVALVTRKNRDPADLDYDGQQEDDGQQDDSRRAAAHAEVMDLVMRGTASRWDLVLVELIGALAAAVSAAVALRSMNGTANAYSLPWALACLKVPTGALTAVLGLLLLRGGFVPGFSNLDDSGQIVAWAAVFGGAQQLVTRLVDQRAENVLGQVGTPGTTKAPDGTTVKASEAS